MALWRAKDKPPVELVVANLVHEKTGGSKMGIAEMLDELKQKAYMIRS